jgi:uncharacterized peroxidase-related enzyme
MKLGAVERGSGATGKLKLLAASAVLRDRAPDVLRTMLYRPEFFGRDFLRYTHQLMRGPSEWTVGERELFAGYVSQLNKCSFCTTMHCSIASKVLGQEVVEAALSDRPGASLPPQVRGALAFLEKLMKQPRLLGGRDVHDALAAGITETGLMTVVHVGVNFSIINRIADALGFEIPSTTSVARLGSLLLRVGYKF